MKECVLRDDCDRIIMKSYHSVLSPHRREYSGHHHTECEFSVFLAGSGKYAVHDKAYDFHAGDVFLFGSNEAHSITEIDEPMELLNIHFEPKLLWERSESAALLNLFAARSKSFSNRFPAEDPRLGQMVKEIEREISEQRPLSVITAKCQLFSALVYIIRHYDCIDPAKVINSHSSLTRSLRDAIHYINENLTAKLTLDEIASVACMTPTYFSSVFKKFNGVSPWEYITIKRVERAIEMLRSTDMTKLEIAGACGFSSSSNFYKAFLHITGKQPGYFVRK